MRAVEALYEDGVLKPAEPLPFESGETISLFVRPRTDPSRWDFVRIEAAAGDEDLELAETGLAEWVDLLD